MIDTLPFAVKSRFSVGRCDDLLTMTRVDLISISQ